MSWTLAEGAFVVRRVDERLAALVATDAVDRVKPVPGNFLVSCTWTRRGRTRTALVLVASDQPTEACDKATRRVRETNAVGTAMVTISVWRIADPDDLI